MYEIHKSTLMSLLSFKFVDHELRIHHGRCYLFLETNYLEVCIISPNVFL